MNLERMDYKLCSMILLHAFLLGCGDGSIKHTEVKHNDTVLLDIPAHYRIPEVKENYTRVRELLRLENLEKGFDSLQIRIWGDIDVSDTIRLIVFKCKNNRWSGQLFNYNYVLKKHEGSNYEIDSIHIYNKEFIEPVSGWDEFSRQIFQLGIKTLPDWSLIKNYGPLNTDEPGYEFEIADKQQYRIYSYPIPQKRRNRIAEANKSSQIMELIEREFNLQNNYP
jgi:hypothetical protein